MKCALEWFARQGYHNTKVSNIVKSAGVSQGTFYWYFESKEQLAIQLVEDGKQQLIRVIRQGYRKNTGTLQDMISSSTRLLADLFTFADQNRYLMALLLIKGQGADPSVQEAVAETWIAFEEAFKNNMRRAVELEMLPSSIDIPLRGTTLVSLITGSLTRWLFGPMYSVDYQSPYTPTEIAEETAKFEFHGLLG